MGHVSILIGNGEADLDHLRLLHIPLHQEVFALLFRVVPLVQLASRCDDTWELSVLHLGREYHGDDVEAFGELHEFLHLFVEVASPDILDVCFGYAEDFVGGDGLFALRFPLSLGLPITLLHLNNTTGVTQSINTHAGKGKE